MKPDTIEVPETGLEVVQTGSSAVDNLNDEKINAIIRLAEQTEKLGKALDTIRKFVLGRALPGDFVKFSAQGGEGYLSLVGAGAERIASALGISFLNFSDEKDSGTDKNGQWFTWRYKCDVTLHGRTIESVEGRASSRDLFFGFANGKWKEIADVKEADIRTAARRNAMKESVGLILGLRRIPESSARELGLDPAKVKSVSFGGKGGTTTKAPEGTSQHLDAKVEDVKAFKKNGRYGAYTDYVVHAGGQQFSTTKKEIAELAKAVKGAEKPVRLEYASGQYGNTLKAVVDVPVGEPEAEDNAAGAGGEGSNE